MGLKRWGVALFVGAALTLIGCGSDGYGSDYSTSEFTNQNGDHCTQVIDNAPSAHGQVSVSCTPTKSK